MPTKVRGQFNTVHGRSDFFRAKLNNSFNLSENICLYTPLFRYMGRSSFEVAVSNVRLMIENYRTGRKFRGGFNFAFFVGG